MFYSGDLPDVLQGNEAGMVFTGLLFYVLASSRPAKSPDHHRQPQRHEAGQSRL